MRPKENFLKNPERSDWERIVTTNVAEHARDAALLEFVAEMPPATDPSKSWDHGSQLTGAKRVLEILFNLHLKEEPPKTAPLKQIPIPK